MGHHGEEVAISQPRSMARQPFLPHSMAAAPKWLVDGMVLLVATDVVLTTTTRLKFIYCAGVKHVNVDVMTRLPIVRGVSLCSRWQWIHLVMWLMQLLVECLQHWSQWKTPVVPPPEWPLDKEWECSWLASEDWFQEPFKLVSTSGEQSRGQGQPNKTDEGECRWAMAHEECGQATPEDKERGQATASEDEEHGQAVAPKDEERGWAAAHEECELAGHSAHGAQTGWTGHSTQGGGDVKPHG
jgi:hypothetical protein